MKILEPVADVPAKKKTNNREPSPERLELMAAARNAVPQWVPVECADMKEAGRLRAASSFKRYGYETLQRGNVIYVRYLDGVKPE